MEKPASAGKMQAAKVNAGIYPEMASLDELFCCLWFSPHVTGACVARSELYVWSCMSGFKIFGSRAVKSWHLTPTYSKLEEDVELGSRP